MKIKRLFANRHTLELVILTFVLSLLPILNGGESNLAKIIFLTFPLFYIPFLFSRKRATYRFFQLIFWLWIIFLLISLVSTINSISLTLSVPAFIKLLGVFLWFVFFYLVVDSWSDLRNLSFSILAVGLLLSLVSIFFIFSPPVGLSTMNLVYAKFGHNHLADYLIFVLPISIGFFLQQKKKTQTIISALLVLFFFISFYFTFARAAFLVVSLITLFLIWFFKPSVKKTVFLLFFGLFPLILVVSFILISSSQLGHQFTSSAQFKKSWFWRQVIKPPQQEGRFEYWRQASEGFALRPFLGNGPGTFRLTSRRFQQNPSVTSWFAHNSLLQTASELGIFGLVSLGSLLFIFLTKINIPRRYSFYALPLFLGVIGSLIQSLFDFNFDFLAIRLLFWSLIAVLLKLSAKSRGYRFSVVVSPIVLFLTSFICFLFVVSSLLSSYFLSMARRAELTSTQRAFDYYRLSTIFPSLEPKRFQDFLRFVNVQGQKARIQSLEKFLIAWNREDSEIYRLLAQIYQADDLELSYTFLKRASQLDPSHQKGHQLALAQYRLGDLSGAVQTLLVNAKAFAVMEDFPFPDEIFTFSYSESSLEKIVPRYMQEVPLDPFDYYPRLLYELGLERFESGNYHASELLWETAIYYSPGWSHLYIELASLYALQEDYSMARKTLEKCVQTYNGRTHCEEVMPLFKEGKVHPPPGYYEWLISIK
jgi:tetratricopeptide (TPR) repeat protein/O-antigen ligase